jgi:hypothetical protein
MYHFKWYMSGNGKIKNGLMQQTNEYDCKKKVNDFVDVFCWAEVAELKNVAA